MCRPSTSGDGVSTVVIARTGDPPARTAGLEHERAAHARGAARAAPRARDRRHAVVVVRVNPTASCPALSVSPASGITRVAAGMVLDPRLPANSPRCPAVGTSRARPLPVYRRPACRPTGSVSLRWRQARAATNDVRIAQVSTQARPDASSCRLMRVCSGRAARARGGSACTVLRARRPGGGIPGGVHYAGPEASG